MSFPLERTGLLGFGEAAMAFAEGWGARARAVRAFDIKTADVSTAAAKREDYARFGVAGGATAADAVRDADLVLSLVTADRAVEAARSAAPTLKPGALYCDFNSIAPFTKAEAAKIIEGVGGRYADVAVMAPVRPARLSVPLLVSGTHAGEACALLAGIGFSPRAIAGPVGRASMIKMLRSVIVKGIEALTAECFLAAHAAGVTDEVAQSLDASWPGADWAARADYNLDRMMVHGLRRAAEMAEVAKTLEGLGTGSAMTRAAGARQRRIGALGLAPPPGLEAKSAMLTERLGEAA